MCCLPFYYYTKPPEIPRLGFNFSHRFEGFSSGLIGPIDLHPGEDICYDRYMWQSKNYQEAEREIKGKENKKGP